MTKLQKILLIGVPILIGGYFIYKQKNCRLKKLTGLIKCSSDLCEQHFFDTKNNKVVIREVWTITPPSWDKPTWSDNEYFYLDEPLATELEALYQLKKYC